MRDLSVRGVDFFVIEQIGFLLYFINKLGDCFLTELFWSLLVFVHTRHFLITIFLLPPLYFNIPFQIKFGRDPCIIPLGVFLLASMWAGHHQDLFRFFNILTFLKVEVIKDSSLEIRFPWLQCFFIIFVFLRALLFLFWCRDCTLVHSLRFRLLIIADKLRCVINHIKRDNNSHHYHY